VGKLVYIHFGPWSLRSLVTSVSGTEMDVQFGHRHTDTNCSYQLTFFIGLFCLQLPHLKDRTAHPLAAYDLFGPWKKDRSDWGPKWPRTEVTIHRVSYTF